MPEALEILKYTIPALLVVATVWVLIRNLINNEQKRRNIELSISLQKTVLPIRLQAYERVIILLERISPDALIMRISQVNKSGQEYRLELLAAIKSEFEHNLSQQVYMSREAWEMVKNAKANIISIINNASQQIRPDASAIILCNKIIEMGMELTSAPCTAAIDFIKKEVQQFY
jgi:hypothetical protein